MPTVTRNPKAIGVIRSANTEDVATIYQIEQQAFSQEAFKLSQFHQALKTGRNIFLVFMTEQGIVGYIWALLHQGRPHISRIYSIAVLSEFQGCGVAVALLEELIQQLKIKNCTELRLEVRTDNTAAQKFYTKMGFMPFGTISNYYADGKDAIRMREFI